LPSPDGSIAGDAEIFDSVTERKTIHDVSGVVYDQGVLLRALRSPSTPRTSEEKAARERLNKRNVDSFCRDLHRPGSPLVPVQHREVDRVIEGALREDADAAVVLPLAVCCRNNERETAVETGAEGHRPQ
jgi:hypothetical protein